VRLTRTVAVWCPDWPVAAAGFAPDDSVVVVHANRVVACSAAARVDGVRRGLRRREAQARSPSAEIIAHDPARDARAFEPVIVAVEAFVPGVEVVRPGVCAFAARGPSRFFGGDKSLAAQVAAAVEPVAGRVQIGVAEGLFAAVLAARRAVVVPAGQTSAFLAPFSVDALDRPELADLLRRLGVRTLGDLAALPARDVLARFGPDGARAHRLARGLPERPAQARVPPPDLTVTAELDPPVDRVDVAAFRAKSLADELGERLRTRGLACSRLLVEAETEHGEHLRRLWRHEGALNPAAMAERVRWQLDGWLTAGGASAGLTLLRLAPDEVHPDDGRQQGFWGGSAADERAARVLARLQGMLGPEAVVTAVVGGGRDPVERVRLVPWGDPRDPAKPAGGGWPGAVPQPAPALVHDPPLPAEVVDEAGQLVGVSGRGTASAPPARLSKANGQWVDVVAWAGPWLVEQRWWDPAAHQRRARWQVLTGDGVAYLLAVESGRWWVEATYD
jgi:protein ImuB